MLKLWKFLHASLNFMKGMFENAEKGKTTVKDDIIKAFAHVEKRKVSMAVVALAFFLYFLSGVYLVNPGEVAVIRRFGKVVKERVTEGLRYRLPWPVELVDKVNVTQIRREGIGVALPQHLPVICPPGEFQVLTGDENIVNVKIVIQYKVKDPVAYLFKVKYEPYGLVRNAVKYVATEIIGSMTIDNILTVGRLEAQNLIMTRAQKVLSEYKSGIQIVSINFEEVSPPEEVVDAFREVAGARIEKKKIINEAEGYFNSLIPQARGKAQRLISQAEAYKEEVINRAIGDAEKFTQIYEEYERKSLIYSKEVTRYRLFLETVEKILPKVKIYALDSIAGEKTNLRFVDQK